MLTISLILAVIILASELIAILQPLVVWFVTWLVRKVAPSIAGWVIVMLVVPLLSLLITWLTELLGTIGLTFWEQFGYGLLAVFVNELFKQLKES